MATLPPITAAPTARFAAKRPPISHAEMARRDALKAIAQDIPDPEEYAWHLPKPYCFWLAQAYRSQDPANAGCYRVADEHIPDMFSLGLCDRDGYLMAFGQAVRRAMQRQSA